MIEVNNVTKIYKISNRKSFLQDLFLPKTYKKIYAVKNINLNIEQGEKVGYIGSNGAGKSTTVKLLTGIIRPTQGRISINGLDPFIDRNDYVKNIGVVFGQRNQLFWDLRVRDSFKFNKDLYQLSDNYYKDKMKFFEKYIDLHEILDKPVMKLSLGQKMRANIALTLLHSPKIIFLDEPTIGLDIFTKAAIREMLLILNKVYGTTILFTSHDMEDIDKICDRIVLLENGEIIEDKGILDFKEKYGTYKMISFKTKNASKIKEKIELLYSDYVQNNNIIIHNEGIANKISISVDEKSINASEIIKEIFALDVDVQNIKIDENNLEDIIRNVYAKGGI